MYQSGDIELSGLLQRQLLPLASVANARQLGGYRMADGRRVRDNLLLRGGSLAALSPDDLTRLRDTYRLRLVFDFRSEIETRLAPDRKVAGSRYIWLPVIDPDTEKPVNCNLPSEAYNNLPGFLVQHASDPRVQQVARNMYTETVLNEYSQLQYAAFFEMLVDAPEGAVYWHCAQGKDRTGLAAALLLAALGADRETILRDYELSNVYYRADVEPVLRQVTADGGGDAERQTVIAFLGAHVGFFDRALTVVERKYGSLTDYLTGPLCLTGNDIDTLRGKYLEK